MFQERNTVYGCLFFLIAPVLFPILNSYAASVRPIDINAVYTWQQSGTGDWQAPSSWTPERIAPAPSDILLFNAGGTITATNVPTQTIGQLLIAQNSSVSLLSQGPVILTISGGNGDDLVVASGSALTFNGSEPLICNLSGGTTGRIDGPITFSSTASAPHRLTAADTGALVFEKGATFTAGTGFTGNPFGTTSLNSVIFERGATYVAISGGDPFGAPEPESVVVFNAGSLYSLRSNASASFSGRTYADFELNYPGGEVFATGSSALRVHDLSIVNGKLNLYMTGDPGHSITGNISCTTPGLFYLAPLSPGTIHLNGSERQTISMFCNTSESDSSTVAVDNPSGVFVPSPGHVGLWNLELNEGVITIEAYYPPLEVLGTVTRKNGYVNGYMRRYFFTPGTYTYDVGTENGYSPVTLDLFTAGHPASLTVKAHQSPQPNIPHPEKALSRYWEVYDQTGVTANLTFHYLDSDVPPTANENNFVIERYDGSSFTQMNGLIDRQAKTFRVNNVTNFARDWTLAEPSALVPNGHVAFDFDGDGKADISVFRPAGAQWYLDRSTAGFFGAQFGASTDKPVPADFTGDGKADIAFWRASTGEWYVLRSEDSTFYAFPFGANGDIPVPADFDGDGKADAAVYRPSAQTWFILRSTGGVSSVPFGLSGDVPVPADYDGDGKSDVAIYRPGPGQWWFLRSSNNTVFAATFGSSTDKPVPGDYTGDGKADIAFYRPSEGNWYVLRSENFTYYAFPFGNSTDKPAPADFDGDGKYDAAVFRPSDTNWYIARSTGGVQIQQFGAAGDVPLPGAFVP